MLDKKSAEAIELLNYFSDMEHRTQPYDLTKIEDLKHALMMAVAAYCDYSHYNGILNELIELYDESLEHYDTATWINMIRASAKTDSLAVKCATSLSKASNNFSELSKRARENLSVILKVVMTAPDAIQLDLLGRVYDISPDDIDERLDDLFLYHIETDEYQYVIEDSFTAFLKIMNEWANPEPEPETDQTGDMPF